MIGGDGVTNVQEAVSAVNAVDGLGVSLSRLEERWVVDVGGGFVPFVKLARWSIKFLPHL